MRREISPQELLDQISCAVEMFAADPAVQNGFADAEHMPAEEIALQFYDLLDVSLHRLREARLIDDQDELLLMQLDV